MVIHGRDLHGIFLRACRRAGVELLTDQKIIDYENTDARGPGPP
jgi:salicylate hydroxylase